MAPQPLTILTATELHIMIYLTRNAKDIVTGVSTEYSDEAECRQDWNDHTTEQMTAIADAVSLLTGEQYIAIDTGCLPRNDVIRVPAVGDKVSYAFNGDSYPCGEVVKVSKTLKVITVTDGRKFYRRGKSGAWVNSRTWSLTQGHTYKQNPSF